VGAAVTGRSVLSVSDLAAQLRAVMEERFPAVWVEGEISNFKVHASGHAYFTLKDAGAQIRAVLFRNRTRRIRFEPRDGIHVMAFGAVEVYAQRGEYQLVVEMLEPRGLGALQLAFEQLKARLDAEGLFDARRKRALPRYPRRIGIVTSPTGAALKDMLRVIGRRFGELHIVIARARVQGDGAAEEIVQGIRDLNALGDVDVMIVGRGGGSLEDLWAFNEEAVARAIVASKIPVISAVGHEVDFTIADFVADLRAPTPSAAAELVVREKRALAESVDALTHRLHRSMARRLERDGERVAALARRRVLTDPHRPLRDLARRVDDARARLLRAGDAVLARSAHRLDVATAAVRAGNPVAKLVKSQHRLEGLRGRLHAGTARVLDRSQHQVARAVGRLGSLSPLAVLGRGYSVTRRQDGTIVRRAQDVVAGEAVSVLVQEGTIDCRVTTTRERDDRPQV
jgi:exodeoxyribonuclease VII large subunit